ncbi:connexin 36.7 [Electrophorus electricus]|uniref:Gap junction protein n=1 Tax=Electrophorus electricus TaxID=8005 RepID=A0A4W4GEC4_ELEEL|nr:connexin 36.7 [Electrophorus electricus]
MTEWTLLKRLLDAVHQHSTLVGRLWLTVMVTFRLLVVAVAAEDVYADEREMFACDTLQPGCPNVCYDAFAPISQPRFWAFHVIAVSTPSLCFVVYTWHSLAKETPVGQGAGDVSGRSCDSDSCSGGVHRHPGCSRADVFEDVRKGMPTTCSATGRECAGGGSSGVLSKVYVCHVVFRAALEVGFLAVQWVLFGFRVPAHFMCVVPPCTQRVDCYVSRPTEKTIFLVFMFCVGVLCIFLNFLELNHLGWKKIRMSMRMKEDSWRAHAGIKQDGRSLVSLNFRDVTSTASLPTLDLMVDHRADWTCTGNFSPLKEGREDSPQTATYEATKPARGKTQSPKGTGSKLRVSEVWI